MFKPVNSKISFPQMEENILSFWNENKIFEKSLDQTKDCEEYVFYDGPPFATGLPHYGHLVPGTIKDVIPRYQTMKGKKVERVFGWDCHGLPVESIVQKELGISGYKAITDYGVAEFNEKCRSIVLKYTSEWKNFVSRVGRWVDFENGYRTMDKEYMESIWWVFKSLYEKGYIYEGFNILPYSPALSSPLSNMEVNLGGYKDVIDPAVTVKFKVDGEENTYFLAWTTTPWTLPSNLALAVGEEIDYVKIQDEENGEFYYLAKALLNKYYKDQKGCTIVKEVKGSELKGRRYEPLFPYFAHLKEKGAFVVVLGDYVTTQDGCGIVHTAPGFGEDDYKVLKGTGIPTVCPIDEECKFTSEVKEYEGLFVKDADKLVIQHLKETGALVKRENYLHSYPFCWRTGAPLIYRAMSCWFVDVPKIKEDMLSCNEQISWIPSHIKHGRFGKWLEGAREWAISRNRFWGNPIPVWKCDGSKHIEVIGSIEELEAKSGVKVTDIHKHFVDEITWPSPDGKGTMRRIGDVLDCWFESGSMPYAQFHYPFENKEKFDAKFPADFINEGIDQTRGWFYSLTVIAAGLFGKPAFYNCICSGIVLAEDGKKMSKSLNNFTPPIDAVNELGADSMRFALMNSAVTRADDIKFGNSLMKESIKVLLLPLYNAYSFFVTYANIDNYKPGVTEFKDLTNPLDKWVLSASNRLIDEVTNAFDNYVVQDACEALVKFIDDLNNWYIRRSRRRFWKSENDGDKKAAYDTLYKVLMNFITVASPLIPFLSEEIYQNLKTDDMAESIHLLSWPEKAERDTKLEDEMSLIQKAVVMGRSLRVSSNLKTRQPLKQYFIVDRNKDERDVLIKNSDIIKEELNVKSVTVEEDESGLVTYSAKANFKVLGAKLGKNMKEVASIIMTFASNDIASIIDGNAKDITYSQGTYSITESDLIVTRSERENVKALNEGSLTVGYDTELNDELINEGISRDIVRFVQTSRKEMGLEVSDHIVLSFDSSDKIKAAIEAFAPYIQNETLADSLTFSSDCILVAEIHEEEVKVKIEKV